MPPEILQWLGPAKPVVAVFCLAALWTWETFFPLVERRQLRWRHAGRNIAVALLNVVVLGVLFGAATVGVALWANEHNFGLLNWLGLSWPWRMIPAVLLLDCWLYLWHRANHRVALLWRFHRMHHSDREMDVTTATRFHIGEHFGAATLRLGLIPILGVTVAEIVLFETLVVIMTMFHHSNLSLGRFDRPLRWLIVTPRMHQIHHSRLRHETDSNYCVLFSFWDRLARSYQMRRNDEAVELGLDELDDDRWQSVAGMLKTPFMTASRPTANQSVPETCRHAVGRSDRWSAHKAIPR